MSDCPRCGQPMESVIFQDDYRIVIHNGRAVPLGIIAYTITKLLYAQCRSISELVESIYTSPNGGPMTARDVAWTAICEANKKLATVGLKIKSNRHGRGAKIGLVHA